MGMLVAAVVGIPFLAAVLCLVVRDRASRFVAISGSVLAAAAAIWLASSLPSQKFLFGGMPWLGTGAAEGFFGYELGPLAFVMLLASTVLGVAIAVYSAGYLSPANRDHSTKSGQARYNFWLMLFVGSMAGLAISPTLLQMLIFWEMTTVCSWALISFYDDVASLKAGMKALVMTSFGGLFFLAGLVWVVSATGSAQFSALGQMSPGARAGAFSLFLIAAWAKSAQVPFQTWLPEAMAAPTPISAYLHAAAMVKAGVFLTAKLLVAGWVLPIGMGLLISIAALVTMFVALYFYFFQDDMKQLLAYSTIAQLGYVFLGLGVGALGAPMATRGAVLHILMHSCAKTTLFLTVGAIAYATGTRSISKLSGLAREMPVAAVAFFVGALALTGVPPLPCFWSKMYVLAGALQVPGAFGPVVLVLVLLESLITFTWFLWVGQKVFFGKPGKAGAAGPHTANEPQGQHGLEPIAAPIAASMKWVLIAMIVVTILVPLVGIPIVSHLIAAP